MSKLTMCNYCSLKRIRAQAMSEGMRVVMRKSTFELGGTNVYVMPEGVKMPNTIMEPSDALPNGDAFHEKYGKSWFMEIPNKCCC